MLAVIEKENNMHTITFERTIYHSVAEVWAMLTEKEKLNLWFDELKVEELREGGRILFDMQDGTYEEMRITELKVPVVLEFTWGEDIVRFELYENQNGCILKLIEKLHSITDHTPKDIAGWHVCLDVIEAILGGAKFPSRKESWEVLYAQYIDALKPFH
ncbi:SRPBCC family protein [Fredinandcohnia sp. 179-A 10B2 NHS]|uniref:SRPBCC family protein n=1 Tax=Fredinandcohnia sp. 179-A 10B2 NHS TaxID=3235176 RepID=UPI0039A32378